MSMVESCVNGIDVPARPLCVAFITAIIIARALDNLLFKFTRVAATRNFSLTKKSSSLPS
jgi:hypothetical protein